MKQKTMPKSEARPLGTPKLSKKNSQKTQKVVDASSTHVVDSQSQETKTTDAATHDAPAADYTPHTEGNNIMSIATKTFHLSTKQRKSSSVVFTSPEGIRVGSARFPKTMFPDGVAPATIDITAHFATGKAKLSAEERKAARVAAPKLTPAEKLAKLEARVAKLKAKTDAAAATM